MGAGAPPGRELKNDGVNLEGYVVRAPPTGTTTSHFLKIFPQFLRKFLLCGKGASG